MPSFFDIWRHLLPGTVALALALVLGGAAPAAGASRVKDIADFEGVRGNMLVGYGLVVGLNGTGDLLRNSNFTRQSLVSMLERLGVSTRGVSLETKNVAAVMVTATLPAFARQGSRIDVQVSALGDAKSLLGADSDDVGRAFRTEVGHLFRPKSAGRSDRCRPGWRVARRSVVISPWRCRSGQAAMAWAAFLRRESPRS
jgi:hypothetical protein